MKEKSQKKRISVQVIDCPGPGEGIEESPRECNERATAARRRRELFADMKSICFVAGSCEEERAYSVAFEPILANS